MIYSPANPKTNPQDMLRAALLLRKEPELLILLGLSVNGAMKLTDFKSSLYFHNITLKKVLIPALIAKGFISEVIRIKPRFFCNRPNNTKITLYSITPAGENYLKSALQLS